MEVVSACLPLLDSFDAAVQAQQLAEAKSGPPSPGEGRIHAAYRALHQQLLEVLKDVGVRVLGPEQVGAAFDPINSHEAIMRQPPPPGVEDDTVLQVLRPGYAVGDKLIRAALVIVAQD